MQQFETNFDDNGRVPGRMCELKYGRLVDRPLCHDRPLRHPRNGAFAESNSSAAQVAYTSAIQLLIILSHQDWAKRRQQAVERAARYAYTLNLL
jgi:hypothetical protein